MVQCDRHIGLPDPKCEGFPMKRGLDKMDECMVIRA